MRTVVVARENAFNKGWFTGAHSTGMAAARCAHIVAAFHYPRLQPVLPTVAACITYGCRPLPPVARLRGLDVLAGGQQPRRVRLRAGMKRLATVCKKGCNHTL